MKKNNNERIHIALTFIPADDRDLWVEMAMAVKSELGEAGFDLWDNWSRLADSYNARDAHDVWKSIRPDGGITIDTLFHKAKQYGWTDCSTAARPSPQPLEKHSQTAMGRTSAEDAEICREREQAQAWATALWKASSAVDPCHPYLVRKAISPVDALHEIDVSAAVKILGYPLQSSGEYLTGRLLLVPVMVDGRLSTCELIDPNGRKTALRGRGTKAGGFWAAQPMPDNTGTQTTLLIGEGMATVLSAKSITGHLAVAALSSTNLVAVAKAMRQRYPEITLVILADLVKTTRQPDPHALQAAQQANGLIASPSFGEDQPGWAKDFNDMATLCGAEAVKKTIEQASMPTAPGPSMTGKNGPGRAQQPALVYRRVSDIQPRPVEWLWPGRIARGKVSLLAGDPGLGKSQLSASMAAVVTTGGTWPVDQMPCRPGNVVFLSAEDDAEDTIRPRLEAAGADLSRVFILEAVVDGHLPDGSQIQRSFRLKSDLARLDTLMSEIGEVALLIIDPISAYLGDADSHKNTEVRSLLAPLADLAAKHGAAAVCITHLNKANNSEAWTRVTGSLAFVAAARAAFFVVKDKEEERRRLFLPVKNNIGNDQGGLAFSIEPVTLSHETGDIETSRLVWEREPVAITVAEATASFVNQDDRSSLRDAIHFLEGLLLHGPVRAKRVQTEAEEAGFAWRTIQRAKKELGVQTIKEPDMQGGWIWRLPEQVQQQA